MNDRKRQVIRIAKRLFIENGFPATSIQHILDEADISKGTFYNYFKSKNDCLKAILQLSYEEATMLRRELVTDHNKRDRETFAEQVALRLVIHREENLLPLYEAVFYSGDEELMQLIEQHFKEELLWMAERFVDLNGEVIRPYASDIAIMFTGMMQQYLHLSRSQFEQSIDPRMLVHYLMDVMSYAIPHIVQQDRRFIGSALFKRFEIPTMEHVLSSAQIVQLLQQLIEDIPDLQEEQLQYAQFLMEELQRPDTKSAVMNTVLRAFRASFVHTRWEEEVNDVCTTIWKYLDEQL